MKTETIASHSYPLVFSGLKAATNMPYFDGKTLVFCQSVSPIEKTIKCTGSIWKTTRHNKVLAERFKNLPRTQEIQYRAWKLAYCNWEDKVIHPINTGLPENVAERSPSFYREGGKIHLSFISGIPSEAGHSYQLYTTSGPDLEHMAPATPLFRHRLFFGFVSQHHICWGVRNVLNLKEKATGKTFRLTVNVDRVACVSVLAKDPAKLLITGLDKNLGYQTFLYDLATGNTSNVSVGGPVYKSSLDEARLVFVQKKTGFENRELCYGDLTITPSTAEISKVA
jgi:hypothetical protein